MGKFYGIPETRYGWIGLITGMAGAILWGTQMLFDWFGITAIEKSIYSLIVLALICIACGSTLVANRIISSKFLKRPPLQTIGRTSFLLFLGAILLIFIVNGLSMTLSTDYTTYANNNLGIFTGLTMLSSVTTADVNSLTNFALGIRQIITALFLVVPCLIATWGGLSVLTSDSIDEAEGGILAIVAAFVVFIIVFIFKAIGVTLL
jgi:hypothetical protein